MRTLILAEGELSPSCSKTHISYCFNIKKEISKLDISFSYEPKILEDLKKSKKLIIEGIYNFVECDQQKTISQWESFLPVQNLLTISVDDSEKFRGCVHRQSSEQHLFITSKSASPGLILGDISLGIWRVTISVHAVVTDICKYNLHILEVE